MIKHVDKFFILLKVPIKDTAPFLFTMVVDSLIDLLASYVNLHIIGKLC